jgi:predicted transposase/invertase (TIGR01784 family)
MKIPLLRDIVFRKVFAEEKTSEPTLRALLNAILGLEGKNRILSLEINDPNLLQSFGDKNAVLDVKATDSLGHRYNVEVQLLRYPNFHERCLHYWARLFNENFVVGEPYSKLRRTICIAILDHPFEETYLHNIYRLRSVFDNLDFSDHLEIHTLDLTKFKLKRADSLTTPFEKWLHFLKYSLYYQKIGRQLPVELVGEEGMLQAVSTYQRISASSEVRSLLERQERAEHDQASRLEEATAKGEARGEAQGKLNVARTALSKGMSHEEVADITGLTVAEVKQIVAPQPLQKETSTRAKGAR